MNSVLTPHYKHTQCQYPIGPVCQQIVAALEKQGWDCPKIKVEFNFTLGPTILRKIHTITGPDFKIVFSMQHGAGDTLAVARINIPKKEIAVFSDESGPELFVYVGKDWEKEGDRFVNGKKVMAKAKGKPRTYLTYVGADSIIPNVQILKKRKLAEYLVATNNFGRDYSPKNDEPTYYKTDEIFQEFVSYLEENVLKEIEKLGIYKDFFVSLEGKAFTEGKSFV